MAVELAPELLEILACPNCHGALAVDHEQDVWSAWRPTADSPIPYGRAFRCC